MTTIDPFATHNSTRTSMLKRRDAHIAAAYRLLDSLSSDHNWPTQSAFAHILQDTVTRLSRVIDDLDQQDEDDDS